MGNSIVIRKISIEKCVRGRRGMRYKGGRRRWRGSRRKGQVWKVVNKERRRGRMKRGS